MSLPKYNTHSTENSSSQVKIVDRYIHALLSRRKRDEENKNWLDRIADRVTKFTGSMLFVFLHIILFGGWIIVNLGWLPIPPFDESFVVLAMFASVEAIFLSTFVLISQNRMAALADKRADLDLHVSLLAEHEITRLVSLVTEMAKKMNVEASHDPELPELAKDVQPEKVLDKLEQKENNFKKDKKASKSA